MFETKDKRDVKQGHSTLDNPAEPHLAINAQSVRPTTVYVGQNQSISRCWVQFLQASWRSLRTRVARVAGQHALQDTMETLGQDALSLPTALMG